MADIPATALGKKQKTRILREVGAELFREHVCDLRRELARPSDDPCEHELSLRAFGQPLLLTVSIGEQMDKTVHEFLEIVDSVAAVTFVSLRFRESLSIHFEQIFERTPVSSLADRSTTEKSI